MPVDVSLADLLSFERRAVADLAIDLVNYEVIIRGLSTG